MLSFLSQVFDRFNRLGLCVSYGSSLRVLSSVGDGYLQHLRDIVSRGLAFRLVGDNMNWMTRVHDERADHHNKMTNAFTSIAIVQTVYFPNLPTEAKSAVPVETYLLHSADIILLKKLYVDMICRVLKTHIAAFSFLPDCGLFVSEHADKLCKMSEVVALPVVFYDEQKYSDVFKIMDGYEQLLHKVYPSGEELPCVHIGGDLLTRVRLSGAKRLRASSKAPIHRYSHLHPITFEFFHLQMNVLKYFYKHLFVKSCSSIGTMYSSSVRINRKNVNGDINGNYDCNRDFAFSFIDATIVEACMEFFGIESLLGSPTRHWQANMSADEKVAWARKAIGQFVDQYVLNEVMLRMGTVQTSASELGVYYYAILFK